MGSTGTLNDVIAALLTLVADILPVALVVIGGAGGAALAGVAGYKLWEHVQFGDRRSMQGTVFGWTLGFVAGALMTMFSVWVAFFSFLYTGWN